MSTVDIEEQCDACGQRFPIVYMRSWVEDGLRRYVCLDVIHCRERVGVVTPDPNTMASRVRALRDIVSHWPSTMEERSTFWRELNEIEQHLRMLPAHAHGVAPWAFELLQAFVHIRPLDFGGEPIPSSVRVLLEAAVHDGYLTQVSPDVYAHPADIEYASSDWVAEVSTQVDDLAARVTETERAVANLIRERDTRP